MPAGGYQRPRNPAPVSGPGALSKRTDGGPAQAMRDLPNARYGENAEYRAAEQVAPMAASPAPSPGSASGGPVSPAGPPQSPMLPPVPLTADTQMPGQPVTAGAPIGAGPNSMVLPADTQYQSALSTLQQAAAGGGSAAQALLARLGQGM